MAKLLTRHPEVPQRRLELPEHLQEGQTAKGLYTVERGESYALPIDHVTRRTDWCAALSGRSANPNEGAI